MFKRLISTLSVALLWGQFALVPAMAYNNEVAETVTIKSIPTPLAIVTEFQGENYLLTVGRGCADQLREGAEVTLAVRDHLDGRADNIRTSPYYKCQVKTAYQYTDAIHVEKVYGNKRTALVRDAKGDQFFISYGNNCTSLTAARHKLAYVDQVEPELDVGDTLLVPGNLGRCTLRTVSKIEKKEVEKPEGDVTAPRTVSDVNGIAGNGRIFLYYREGKDNVAVDHYIVGVSRYKLSMHSLHERQNQAMPTTFTTTKNRVWVKGLRNDQTYFFYVKAVDTSGNVSSDWSTAAQVRTSSAAPLPVETTSYGTNAREDGTPARP